MTNSIEQKDGLVSVPELAEYLDVKCSWIYAQSAAGSIPRVRVGRYIKFRLSDVLCWLEGRG